MKKRKYLFVLAAILLSTTVGRSYSQNIGTTAVRDIENILPEKDRAKVMNEILEWRLEHIIPELMRREGIDMWLIICREYNEDPVYLTMVPEPTMAARRTSILIFHDKGEEKGVARLTGSFYGMGKWYKSIFTDQSKDQPNRQFCHPARIGTFSSANLNTQSIGCIHINVINFIKTHWNYFFSNRWFYNYLKKISWCCYL